MWKVEKSLKAIKDNVLWSQDGGRTRNLVNRVTTETSVYAANQIFYSENLEWYLLVVLGNEYRPKLEAALRLLSDDGIGGKRSIGCGGYSYHPPIPLPESLNFVAAPIEDSFVTLSLYYPTLEEVQKGVLSKAKFQLMERQGWDKDTQGYLRRQKKIRLVKEGSHLKLTATQAKSLIPVVSSEESSYHYGYPFRIAAPGGEL